MVNIPLLRKELEYLMNNPGEHDQALWLEQSLTNPCGTKGCLVGNAALHADRILAQSRVSDRQTFYYPDSVNPHRGIVEAWYRLGCELFELTHKQGNRLFCADNTLQELWQIAAEITNHEIVVPLELSDA